MLRNTWGGVVITFVELDQPVRTCAYVCDTHGAAYLDLFLGLGRLCSSNS